MAMLKVKLGDIFEIKTKKGFAYFQCVKEATVDESERIRVLPGIYENENIVNLDSLLSCEELYFIQFPLSVALKKKMVKYIENRNIPEHVVVPRYYRSVHKIGKDFICWHIVDSITLQRRSVEKLTEEEKKLSPFGTWNDTLLAERIDEEWTLDKWI